MTTTMYGISSLLSLALAALPLAADQDQWQRAITEAKSAARAGKTNDALQAYKKAMDATESDSKLVIERVVAMVGRANVLQDLQRTREAEKQYLQALALMRGRPPAEVQTYALPVMVNLAALYLESDQPSKALGLRIETLLPDIKDSAVSANAYGVLGSIALVQSRIDDAEAWWLKALSASETQKQNEDVAVVLSNLGVAQLERRNFIKAAGYFQRSVETLNASIGLDNPRAVKAQANLGQALYHLGRHSEAEEWLGRSHRLAQQWYGKENIVTIRLCLDHAEALRKLGRKQESQALVESVRRLPAGVIAGLRGQGTIDVTALQMQSGLR